MARLINDSPVARRKQASIIRMAWAAPLLSLRSDPVEFTNQPRVELFYIFRLEQAMLKH